MPVDHKFLQSNWNNGFETHSAILDITLDYDPEVLFIGTYNPATHGPHNLATFFYGRNNYLFPLLHGIFNLQEPYNQAPPYDIIWHICSKLKLTFADLVASVFPNQAVQLLPNSNTLIYENNDFNLLRDQDLIQLDEQYEALQWNHRAIAEFINRKKNIKYVYLTQKSNQIFLNKFQILQDLCRDNISFRTIHTPSGQSLPGVPKEFFLGLQWLVQQNNQSGFNLEWLHSHDIHNFSFDNYNLDF